MLAWHFFVIVIKFICRLLAAHDSPVEERTRTSCYVKTNLNRGKRCFRPPLKVLQVVRVSDIFKLRVMEAISFARCEQSSAISSCLSDSQWRMYRDKCVLSAALRKNHNANNVSDATEVQCHAYWFIFISFMFYHIHDNKQLN